jgi:endonuclease V-like protein UPF0215 family
MKDYPISMGIDDARFDLKRGSSTTWLIAVICQGLRLIEVIKTDIIIDGIDSTEKLIDLIRLRSKHVQFILTDTITFGGFNLMDMERVYTEVQKPIIAITEREVDLLSVKQAIIKRFPHNYQEKLFLLDKAGPLYEININTAGGPTTIYFHSKGINYDEVKELLEKVTIDSKLPEPIRMAHLIGKMF